MIITANCEKSQFSVVLLYLAEGEKIILLHSSTVYFLMAIAGVSSVTFWIMSILGTWGHLVI